MRAPSLAQDVKIGVVGPFSGGAADYGKQMEAGMKAWLKVQRRHRRAATRSSSSMRDTGGPNPDVAKRLAQELVTRDKVDFLAGFGFTPEALAAAPIATEAKTPMIVMNAAVLGGHDALALHRALLDDAAAGLGADGDVGCEERHQEGLHAGRPISRRESIRRPRSRTTFTAAGGTVVDSVRVPLRNPDFAPFVQRIKDAKPDAVFMFVPAGEQSIAFMKAFEERGLAKEGIKLIATGDLTDDDVLQSMGDPVAGRDHQPPLLGGARFAGEQGLRRRRSRRWAAAWRGPTSWAWAATTAWPPSPRW